MISYQTIIKRSFQLKAIKGTCTQIQATLVNWVVNPKTKIKRLEMLRNKLSQDTAVAVRDLDKLIKDLKKEADEN
jgi:L-lactate utilization protein LutB